jgi:hypothetical protein
MPQSREVFAEQAGLAVEEVRGAIFYTRGVLLPIFCTRWDLALGGLTTLGASFIAISAVKFALAVERIRNPYAGSRGVQF